MTKRDLITAVSNSNPYISRKAVEEAIDLFFEMMTFYLSHHQRAELRGFGIFSVRQRDSHRAHNPQTGETLVVPSKFVPFFKPSKALKEELKRAYQEEHPKEASRKKMGFFSSVYRDLMGRS
jgi:integration host factor subunit beta